MKDSSKTKKVLLQELDESRVTLRHMEETLRGREKRYRLFAEKLIDVIWTANPDGTFTYVSPAIYHLSGHTAEETMKKTLEETVSPNYLPLLRHTVKELFETVKRGADHLPMGIEVEQLHKNGSSVWTEIVMDCISAETDQSVLLVGTMKDISRHKRTESTLKDSKEWFRTLLENSRDAILMMDSEGKVSYWNLAAELMFGHESNEAIGRNLHELIAPERYHTAHQAAFPEFLRTGQGNAVGKAIELQARRKDGSEITVSLSLSSKRMKDGWHAVGILRDVTEQKRAQEELARSREKLEETNKQLIETLEQATQMAFRAREANIAKSQFLANMSHEIRTPMNGVVGMTELLLDTSLSGEQRHYAETIRASADALLNLINDILDFSKMEANKLDIDEIDFDLRTVLEDTAELLAVRAHEKKLEFVCRVDPGLHTPLQGDPGRLRQVLMNLGGNAIKFTSQGEVFIDVRAESEDNDKIKIRFEVRDTGIGIPQDKIGILFSAFQQVDASTTRKFGGTGLGLAIAKHLSELMGGKVGVESVKNQGSTFWFTAVFKKQTAPTQSRGTPGADVKDARVLVVDDNATNRSILAEQLASWGVRHAETENAVIAIEMLQEAKTANDPFHIVITDMQMPAMDGESLGRIIKADPGLQGTLLIMMTSMGARGDVKRLKSMGFSAYLTKPVKQSQLYNCLAMVLDTPHATADQASETVMITHHTVREMGQHGFRILLAEDNATNQQVALGILKKLGYRADVAINGRDAIRMLETSPYDVLFMDVQMPVMDGLEATRLIRSGKTRVPDPKIPIVAMTAHAMKGDRELCIGAGMDDYITKPIAVQALADTIKKWLRPGIKQADSLQNPPEPEKPAS